MSMTRAELQSLHEQLCREARETQTKKNHDYATESDIFRNFRYFGGLGILVRMSDKLARLRSFEENGVFKVADEKLADTIQDLINYAVIYYAFKTDGLPTPPNVVEMPTPKVVDGPYCSERGCGQSDCGELAKFRVDTRFLTYYFCGPCLEKQSQWMVNIATAMETA